MSGFNMDDYVTVAERIAEFREKYPEGCLRTLMVYDGRSAQKPYVVETIGDKTIITVTVEAWRSPDDPTPARACASEPFPGKTPYTRDSELMNAETSAQGRAIVAALAADTKKGVASAEEVRNRVAERDPMNLPIEAQYRAVPAEAARRAEKAAKDTKKIDDVLAELGGIEVTDE